MVWGFLISLILVVLVVVLLMGTNKQLNLVSYILLVVMYIGLSISVNRLIGVMEIKSQMSDYILEVQTALTAYSLFDSEGVVSAEEAATIALALKACCPPMSKCFRTMDFISIPYSEILPTISSDLAKGINKTLWNNIGWIVLILIVGIILIVITSKKGNNESYSDYSDYSDGGYDIE